MKDLVQEVRAGCMNGCYFFICDFRYNDALNKPIRHVKPQKVLCVGVDEVSKRIYYSKSCFLPLNKKGEPVRSKVIALFDNTGFRSYAGEPLKVFETMDECIKAYTSMCLENIALLRHTKEKTITEIDDKIKEIQCYIGDAYLED